MEVEVFRKSEENARLFQHFGGGAGGILAHAVGYQVFGSDCEELGAVGGVEQADSVEIGQAIEQGGADDFEAQLQVRVYPAARQRSGSRGTNEPMDTEGGLKGVLSSDHIEIACGEDE